MFRRVWLRALMISACALILAPSVALAQFDTATVVGTVRDASNAVVPEAKVTLTATETGISVIRTSAENGSFEFPAVKPGVYLVTAEKTGFAIALVDNVQVQVGARLRVDLTDARRPGLGKSRSSSRHASARNRFEPARPGHHRRPDARAAAHLARVLVAGAADHRREARGIVAHDRQHAA